MFPRYTPLRSWMIAALSLCAAANNLFPWGDEGHRIVGDIAWHFLSDEAKEEVRQILGSETLADAAAWPDTPQARANDAWDKLHYINVPRSATSVDMSRDCGDGDCILAAIERFSADLGDRSKSRSERRLALRFIAHLVGDIHQPLHVSYADDRGGNDVKATFFNDDRTNLHRVWDANMISRRSRGNTRGMYNRLLRGISSEEIRRWTAPADPEAWANESLQETRRIYQAVPGGANPAVTIRHDYCHAEIPLVEQRLSMAGVRLAKLVNDLF